MSSAASCVFGAARREYRQLAEVVQVVEHALFQTANLFGEIGVGKEHSRVREVDHQLGRVLDLR
jgi:hypothetical protein